MDGLIRIEARDVLRRGRDAVITRTEGDGWTEAPPTLISTP